MNTPAVSGKIVLRAGGMVGGTGAQPVSPVAITLLNRKISAISSTGEAVGAGDAILDFGDCWVTPGLIDVHTHLTLAGDGRVYETMMQDSDEMMVLAGVRNLRSHLEAGVTTIRDNGGRNNTVFLLREALQRGYFDGPRMLVCGRPITCTRGHFWFCNEENDGEEALRQSIRRLVHEGADHIKIMASGGGTRNTIRGRATYSVDELRSAIQEAHLLGRLTVAHCIATESMRRATRAGIDLMEHASFMGSDDVVRYDPKVAEMLEEAGVWISPTLQAAGYGRMLRLKRQQEETGLTPPEQEELALVEQNLNIRLDVFRRMLDAGLGKRMVAGSDSGVFALEFGHLDYDLALLHLGGLEPEEVFQAATGRAAEAIGMADRIGTIEPGKEADLTILEADPTKDATAYSRVVAVIKAGQLVYQRPSANALNSSPN